MHELIVALTTLRSGDLHERYQEWVREVDRPTAERMPGVVSYRVFRLLEPVLDDVPAPHHQYLELIEVSDAELYKRSVAEVPASFFEEFRSYVATVETVRAVPVT